MVSWQPLIVQCNSVNRNVGRRNNHFAQTGVTKAHGLQTSPLCSLTPPQPGVEMFRCRTNRTHPGPGWKQMRHFNREPAQAMQERSGYLLSL